MCRQGLPGAILCMQHVQVACSAAGEHALMSGSLRGFFDTHALCPINAPINISSSQSPEGMHPLTFVPPSYLQKPRR